MLTLGKGSPNIHVAEYTKGCYEDDLAVDRALKRVGEKEYNVVTNFARAFPEWCKTGQGRLTHDNSAADNRYRTKVLEAERGEEQ